MGYKTNTKERWKSLHDHEIDSRSLAKQAMLNRKKKKNCAGSSTFCWWLWEKEGMVLEEGFVAHGVGKHGPSHIYRCRISLLFLESPFGLFLEFAGYGVDVFYGRFGYTTPMLNGEDAKQCLSPPPGLSRNRGYCFVGIDRAAL